MLTYVNIFVKKYCKNVGVIPVSLLSFLRKRESIFPSTLLPLEGGVLRWGFPVIPEKLLAMKTSNGNSEIL